MAGERRTLTLSDPHHDNYLGEMSDPPKKLRPSDLPTKRMRAPDGRIIAVKVVKSDSENLEGEILAAFQSNVRRVREERRERGAHAVAANG